MTCSSDGKFLFVGFYEGWIQIINIQNFQSIKIAKVLTDSICSVAFSKTNNKAYVSDLCGNIMIVSWKDNAIKEEDFDSNQKAIKVIDEQDGTMSITLSSDDSELLVGSKNSVYL